MKQDRALRIGGCLVKQGEDSEVKGQEIKQREMYCPVDRQQPGEHTIGPGLFAKCEDCFEAARPVHEGFGIDAEHRSFDSVPFFVFRW